MNFGTPPLEPPPLDEQGRPAGGPLNRRAELWMKSKEWLEDAGRRAGAGFRCAAGRRLRPGLPLRQPTRLKLERKEDMRRRGALSPDEWDAVALTFARPVAAAASVQPPASLSGPRES